MTIRKRLSASLEARIFQPWQAKHFDKTANGRALLKLKNKYRGQKCFFIGNGPSLQAEDLEWLHKNNVITFGFNRVYKIFDQTSWRPDFYISQDEKMLKGCLEDVSALKLPAKLIPIQLKWYHDLCVDDALYFNMEWQDDDKPDTIQFSDEVSQRVYCANTGMYTAAQFAAYMGFEEIYLIGVDHHFRVSQNGAGEIIVDSTAKDYFTDQYNNDKKELYIPNPDKSTITYLAMKQYCRERNIRVYNATRGGKLEVFERVSFENMKENLHEYT